MVSKKVQETLLISVLAIVSYAPSLTADFSFDDRPAILENKDVTKEFTFQNILHHLHQIFQHDFWGSNITDHSTSHKSYRPFTVLTFAINHIIDQNIFRSSTKEKLSPTLFHFNNVLLHAFNSILFYAFVCKTSKKLNIREHHTTRGEPTKSTFSSIAFISATVFSTHPIHTESVAGVVGRADLLYSIFVLLALVTGHLWLGAAIKTSILSFLSVLSKEQGIILIPLLLIFDTCTYIVSKRDPQQSSLFKHVIKKTPLKRTFVYVFVFFLIVYLRLWIMDFRPPTFQEGDNPAAFLSTSYLRQLNFSYIYGLNFLTLLSPDCLCFDWSMGCLDYIREMKYSVVLQPQIIAKILYGLFFWVLMACLLTRAIIDIFKPKGQKVLNIFLNNQADSTPAMSVTLALSLLTLPFIPASNIFFTVGFVIAERNLYLSVGGLSLLVAIGYCKLVNIIEGTSAALCTKPGKRTAKIETHNGYLISIKCLMIFVVVIYMCKSIHRSCQWRSEESLYRSGLKVCPKNSKIHYNIAKLLQNKDTNTIDKFHRMTVIDAKNIVKWTSVDWGEFTDELSTININKTDYYYFKHPDSLVVMLYKTAIRLWPRYEHALNNLANVLRKRDAKHFHVESKEFLLQALKVNSKFSAAWMNLGIVQAQLEDLASAEESYLNGLSLRKDFYPDCHFNLGTLYLKFNDKRNQALYEFSKAIAQDSKHFSAWSNKIILLDELGRFEEARMSAEEAKTIFPEKAEFYFHLGNIFGKQGAFETAEINYQHAIRMLDQQSSHHSKHRNPQSLYRSNLGVLYHRWNRPKEAIKNYEDALFYDPKNTNAKDNLNRLLNKP